LGNQQVRVIRKGSRAEQWLPGSNDAFVWLRLYLAEIGGVGPADPLWVTLRKRRGADGAMARIPLTYEALRAVLRRANAKLGTNWSMHDYADLFVMPTSARGSPCGVGWEPR
jgi:integrase/recombinase XerD